MGRKYEKAATRNFSIGKERDDWIVQRAWHLVEGTSITPNISDVARDAIDCYRHVLELFGENWHDHLAVQSEPKWAKDHILKILDLLEKMPQVKDVAQKELITEIKDSMSVEGMLEE